MSPTVPVCSSTLLSLTIPSAYVWYMCHNYECQLFASRFVQWLSFYVPLKNISFMWRRHHYRWRAAKFRLMAGAQGLLARMDTYRATPAMTFGGRFFRSDPKDRPFSRLLRYTRGCRWSILTRILTGLQSATLDYDIQGDVEYLIF
jgi:hypothetical protein